MYTVYDDVYSPMKAENTQLQETEWTEDRLTKATVVKIQRDSTHYKRQQNSTKNNDNSKKIIVIIII